MAIPPFGSPPGLWKKSGGNTELKTAQAVDFKAKKAVAMACDNGSTFPTSPAPVKGQWFRHTPTGRDILYQYDGSTWKPMSLFGDMTVYVDSTDGGDTLDPVAAVGGGFGLDTEAFKTIQFAVDAIPGMVGGNVTVNINNETYYELVTINGKSLTGTFTITLQGTMAEDESVQTATVHTATTIGTGSGFMTTNEHQKKIVRITGGTGSGQRRVIKSNTTTVITVYGAWITEPENDSTFVVEDWQTIVSGATSGAQTTPARNSCIIVKGGQKGVVLDGLKCQYSVRAGGDGTVLIDEGSACEVVSFWGTECNRAIQVKGESTLDSLDGGLKMTKDTAGNGMLNIGSGSFAQVSSPFIDDDGGSSQTSATGVVGISVLLGGSMLIWKGFFIDGWTTAGISVVRNGTLQTVQETTTSAIISNNGDGLQANTGGVIRTNTSAITFTSNSAATDEAGPTANGHGYIGL